MKINGIEGLTGADLKTELQRGGRFVIYQYCISIVLLTFRRPSDFHFVRGGENAVVKGLGYTLITLLLGWWGIPWGPIYTIGSFITNFGGGKDVTQEVIAALNTTPVP
jgi:hypothetical protein